jgi:hypothetical protein
MSRDKNGYCIPRRPAVPAVPEVARKESIGVQLADAGTMNFDFNIDTHPIIDMFVRTDRALEAVVFVRASPADTFAQLGGVFGPIPAAELHPAASYLINSLRLPGSQARIQLQNNTGAPTTVLVVQVHARSL